jgi:hypothetical protein
MHLTCVHLVKVSGDDIEQEISAVVLDDRLYETPSTFSENPF